MLTVTGAKNTYRNLDESQADRTSTVLLWTRKTRFLVQTPVAPFLDEFLVEIRYAWSLPREDHPCGHHMAEPNSQVANRHRRVGFPLSVTEREIQWGETMDWTSRGIAVGWEAREGGGEGEAGRLASGREEDREASCRPQR